MQPTPRRTLAHEPNENEQDPDEQVAALVDRALAGSEEDWRRLVARFTPVLRATARRYRLSEADTAEVVQLTWVECFSHLGALREAAAFPGWLVTICRRTCLKLRTSQERCRCWEQDVLERMVDRSSGGRGASLDPADVVVDSEQLTRLRAAVDQLPDRQRTVLRELIRSDGVGYRELAAQLSIPVGSIGPTRQRALLSLRTRFEGQAA